MRIFEKSGVGKKMEYFLECFGVGKTMEIFEKFRVWQKNGIFF
jgi:hypothetical protein